MPVLKKSKCHFKRTLKLIASISRYPDPSDLALAVALMNAQVVCFLKDGKLGF